MDLGGIYRIEYLDDLTRIFSVGLLDEKSLYVPIEGKKEFKPVEIQTDSVDEMLRQEKLRKMMQKMEKVLNPQKIDAYVETHMKDRMQMNASELPLENVEDFV